MGANTSSKRRRLLLLAAVLVLLASPAPASARRHPVRLRVYMHDIAGGPGQTAVRLVKGTGPENPSMSGSHFGDTVAIDDLLTEGVSATSAAMGRAQGTYMTGSLHRPVFLVSVTLMLAAGPYNGSTIVVAGREDISQPVRELAVVGGTGKLRRAQGYVLWSAAKVVSAQYAVLELDVHVSVPVPRPSEATTTEAAALLASDLTDDLAAVIQ